MMLSTPPNTPSTPSPSFLSNHSNPVLSHVFSMIRCSSFICAIALSTHTVTSHLIGKLVVPSLIPLAIIHLIHHLDMGLEGFIKPYINRLTGGSASARNVLYLNTQLLNLVDN